MISIKSDYEIDLLRKAGHIVYLTHKYLEKYIKPGITTLEVDKLAHDFVTIVLFFFILQPHFSSFII